MVSEWDELMGFTVATENDIRFDVTCPQETLQALKFGDLSPEAIAGLKGCRTRQGDPCMPIDGQRWKVIPRYGRVDDRTGQLIEPGEEYIARRLPDKKQR